MRKNGSYWEFFFQGGVIVDDNDCDVMFKILGDKVVVVVSQVMNNKQCDVVIVYDLVKVSFICFGEMVGVGFFNLDKSIFEFVSIIYVILDGVGDGCM